MKDLLPRILSGIVFLVVMIGCILGGAIPMAWLFGIITLIGTWEYAQMLGRDWPLALKWSLPILALSLYLGILLYPTSLQQTLVIFGPLSIIFLLEAASRLFKVPDSPMRHFLLGMFYVSLPFGLLASLGYHGEQERVLGLFLLLWTYDSFALVTGRKFGKNKLAERISPKKTWEGLIGGMLFCAIAAIIYFRAEANGLRTIISLTVLVPIFGTLGDLIESSLKRYSGVKDSGKIMPGHGGVLDRFDGMFAIMPALCIIGMIEFYFFA